MIGSIIKLAILVVVVLVALKIFAPEMADDAVNKISETTGVEKGVIEKNLDKATSIAIEKAEELTDAAKEKLDEAKEKTGN